MSIVSIVSFYFQTFCNTDRAASTFKEIVTRCGEEMLGTIETVADLSYAWHALAGYKEAVVQGQQMSTRLHNLLCHAA